MYFLLSVFSRTVYTCSHQYKFFSESSPCSLAKVFFAFSLSYSLCLSRSSVCCCVILTSGSSILTDTRSLLQSMQDSSIHPFRAQRLCWLPRVQFLQGSASSLTHRSMYCCDIICNSSSPSLAGIVVFEFFFLNFPSKFLKHVSGEFSTKVESHTLSP